MNRTLRHRWIGGASKLWILSIPVGLVLAGCAQVPVSSTPLTAPKAATVSASASATASTTASASSTVSGASTASASASAAATPSSEVTTTVVKKKVDPLTTLSKKTKKEFKGCLTKVVGPNSSGKCARLVLKKLKAAKLYPWSLSSSINVAGANAILNYQRSRGIRATARTSKATWVALATNAPAIKLALPAKCKAKGTVLCVDQGQRKLFWLKNGKVVRTFKVRLGGWNYHPKTHNWRVFATANGHWKVFDKQVDPASDNYGSGAMPYATMFHPDMYFHYSAGFNSVGYAKSSHGCVNIRTLSEAKWIFKHTPIGAKVYIYTPKKSYL